MASAPDPGLCGSCRHARVIVNRRGSTFHLCERSRSDPRYPRYPRLPVRACPGWEADIGRVDPGSGADGGGAVGWRESGGIGMFPAVRPLMDPSEEEGW